MQEAPSQGDVRSRISASFKRLVQGAEILGSATDEFSKPINRINDVLQKLHLGVTAWVSFDSGEDPWGNWSSSDIGYARIAEKWGLAIREREGNHNDGEPRSSQSWYFNDAPRTLRVDALEKLPELLDKLTKAAEKTAKKLIEKTGEANEIAAIVADTHNDMTQAAKRGKTRTTETRAAAESDGLPDIAIVGVGSVGSGVLPSQASMVDHGGEMDILKALEILGRGKEDRPAVPVSPNVLKSRRYPASKGKK